jgi:hypothetical protein
VVVIEAQVACLLYDVAEQRRRVNSEQSGQKVMRRSVRSVIIIVQD